MSKPTHAKPSLYAHIFFELKEVAKKYGYNLLLHGSMHRDLDLVAVPWAAEVKPHVAMLEEMMETVGSRFNYSGDESNPLYSTTHHGRMQYVINLNRSERKPGGELADPQYYLDISVMPTLNLTQ